MVTITKTTITPAPGTVVPEPEKPAKPSLRERIAGSRQHGELTAALEPFPGPSILRLAMSTMLSVMCLLTVAGSVLMLLLWQQDSKSGVLTTQVDRTWEIFDHLQQIERWFAVRAGDRFDSARIARAVEGLMQKERFADVQVEGEAEERGVVLYVRVEEFPQLADVRLEGAREIKESDLRGDLRLGPGAFLAPWLLRADVASLTERWVNDQALTWIGLARVTSMAEGDMYRLFARTLEFLSQLQSLRASHPACAGLWKSEGIA